MNKQSDMTFKNVQETAEFLRQQGMINAEVAIILGTGLGRLADDICAEVVIEYDNIPHFPVSTVESHKGRLIYGSLNGRSVVAMQGRFHFYEGYSLKEVTFPVRVMKLLGVKYLLISNAAGALNSNFKKGSLMLLDDHINLLPGNPLIGKNMDEMGSRFPDMSAPYSDSINNVLRKVADEQKIVLHEGVYASVAGPSLETRAEYRFLHRIGADAVGMSTVPEVIVANHINLPCAAVSVLTDECDPDNLRPVSLKEILAIAAEAEKSLVHLFSSCLELLP
jgi:purine-nucleoside phosphorylase